MLRILMALTMAAASAEYKESIEQWRAQQEATLRSDKGWLTVAGLDWLKEGKNECAPFGVFEMRNGKVVLHPAGGGADVEMRPDTSGSPTVITQGDLSVTVIQRGSRMGLRLRDKNSKFRKEFTGRRWFPVNEAYRFEAKWVPYDPPKSIMMPNVLGDKTEEKAPGYAEFVLDGKEFRLEPTDEDGRLFFVFRDPDQRSRNLRRGAVSDHRWP
jgi:uncharacterized protein (DUF1684 family)